MFNVNVTDSESASSSMFLSVCHVCVFVVAKDTSQPLIIPLIGQSREELSIVRAGFLQVFYFGGLMTHFFVVNKHNLCLRGVSHQNAFSVYFCLPLVAVRVITQTLLTSL